MFHVKHSSREACLSPAGPRPSPCPPAGAENVSRETFGLVEPTRQSDLDDTRSAPHADPEQIRQGTEKPALLLKVRAEVKGAHDAADNRPSRSRQRGGVHPPM